MQERKNAIKMDYFSFSISGTRTNRQMEGKWNAAHRVQHSPTTVHHSRISTNTEGMEMVLVLLWEIFTYKENLCFQRVLKFEEGLVRVFLQKQRAEQFKLIISSFAVSTGTAMVEKAVE